MEMPSVPVPEMLEMVTVRVEVPLPVTPTEPEAMPGEFKVMSPVPSVPSVTESAPKIGNHFP